MERWSIKEDGLIRDLYPVNKINELRQRLRLRSLNAIQMRAYRLGVGVSPEHKYPPGRRPGGKDRKVRRRRKTIPAQLTNIASPCVVITDKTEDLDTTIRRLENEIMNTRSTTPEFDKKMRQLHELYVKSCQQECPVHLQKEALSTQHLKEYTL